MRQTQLVTTQGALEDHCKAWRAARCLAFDTEFIRDETYDAILCLVQVSTPSSVVLVDPTSGLDLSPFWDLVADPDVVTIVHAGKEDFDVCQRSTGRLPRNVFDVQIAAGFVGHGYPLSLARLVSQVLGKRMTKGHTLTDWLRRPLTPEQVRYAADDVAHLPRLFAVLAEQLSAAGRSAWAREEFARFEQAAFYKLPPQERAARLRGTGRLDGLGLLVLEKLILWRDDWARQKNRPVRALIRDDILIEIARRRPQQPRDLEILRGFPQARNPAIVKQILTLIEEALAAPPDERPRPVEKRDDSPMEVALLDLLSAVVQVICEDEKLSFPLLGSTQRLRELLDFHAGRLKERPPLLRGWRDEFIGERILDLLEGRSAVRVSGWPKQLRIRIE
ncbi:MAG: ribonuclease D [Phycisphaerales bacterium]|nr:ribonuclease D [Phycisphaerales bacterium]